jgi:hypothetical protein
VERVKILRGKAPQDPGYGSGSGDGDGYGYGSGYWLASIPTIVAGWPAAKRARYEAAITEGATVAFWRSASDGRPANGGKGGARKAGDIEEVPGPLALCGARALHATLALDRWQGPRIWIVALFGEVLHQEDKCGALKREILGEAWCAP